MRAITYRRASTREQGDSGLGLAAQSRKLREVIGARGWEHVGDYHDIASGKSTNGRHGLERALAELAHGRADVLVVSKLDRLSRSMFDFASLLELARGEGWSVVALDVDIDTTTPNGELIAHILAALAQWERRIISERTTAALAEARERGVRLGGRKTVPEPVRTRIHNMRERGVTLQSIADALNVEQVPTGKGGARWYPSTIRAVLRADRVA